MTFKCTVVVVINGWKYSTYIDEPIIAAKCTEQVQGFDIMILQIN
jgi:hypothetical protein